MKYQIPGRGELTIETIILDLNGTLSVGGKIVQGAQEKINLLQEKGFRVLFFTGNTRNDADKVAEDLEIEWILARTAEDKKQQSQKLNPETCASIGNGRIDLELHKKVGLSIVTLQAEGIHVETLAASDIVVPTINDALDLFLDEQRLIATLRS